jgi:hypothetical protein
MAVTTEPDSRVIAYLPGSPVGTIFVANIFGTVFSVNLEHEPLFELPDSAPPQIQVFPLWREKTRSKAPRP